MAGMTDRPEDPGARDGKAVGRGRRRGGAGRRPGDVARERARSSSISSRTSTRAPASSRTVWDPSKVAIIFDHRVPAESSKTATNQKKVREFVGAQGIAKFHDIRGDEGGICHQILPSTATCGPAGHRRHRQPHDHARRAGRVRVRHRRHRDGRRLGARHDPQRRGAGDDQGGRQRHVARARAAQGPDPPPGRQADGRGRQLQGDRVPRRGDPEDAGVGRLVLCNMSVEAGATARHRARATRRRCGTCATRPA